MKYTYSVRCKAMNVYGSEMPLFFSWRACHVFYTRSVLGPSDDISPQNLSQCFVSSCSIDGSKNDRSMNNNLHIGLLHFCPFIPYNVHMTTGKTALAQQSIYSSKCAEHNRTSNLEGQQALDTSRLSEIVDAVPVVWRRCCSGARQYVMYEVGQNSRTIDAC